MSEAYLPVPDEVREAALKLGAAWTKRDDGFASEALVGDFENQFPNLKVPSDARLRKHYRESYAPDMVDGTWVELQKKLAAGSITLWRSVRLPGDPVEALGDDGLGIYWSYDRDQAHPHDNVSDLPAYLLEGTIRGDAIDWVETLAAAAHPDWCGENEVRLLPDADVTLISICRREGWLRRNALTETGEPVDARHLVGQVFKAGRSQAGPQP